MKLQNFKMASGASLLYINTNKFKSEALGLSLTVPLTRRDYLCNMLLSGVMRRGSQSLPSHAEVNRRLDMLYAASVEISSNTSAGSLSLNVGADFLSSRHVPDGTDVFEGVVEVIGSLLVSPLKENGVFPRKTVKSEIELVRDSLRAEKNNTRAYAAMRCRELLKRDNASYPTLEYLLENIDTVTPEELTRYHEELLTRASVSVFYVGGRDAQSVCDSISRAFGGALFAPARVCAPERFDAARPHASGEETMDVSQGKLSMGFVTGTGYGREDRHTAIVLNELLGASPASKLFLNVREKEGLCYYCSSSYSAVSGNILVSSGIDAQNRQRVTDAVLSQLDAIRQGDISDAELACAKSSLAYSYAQIYDSPFSLQAFYSTRVAFGEGETVEECRDALMSVTREDVVRLANNIRYDCCFFLSPREAQSGEVSDDE